ncbi:MAG: sugar kinase, partial [Dehalococcoidia bacterium]|nr:sugar kinase [Dehalococcoidia bacterium]
AGDAFVAGFIAGLLKGEALEVCTRWANAMGAFSVMGDGPYQNLPNWEDFQVFLAGESDVIR